MRDVCFIADVAVLPRWIRVSQALDYVAGVHPRFDRAKAEAFLAKTTIRPGSKVRELSKGMVTQLHLARGDGDRRAAAGARRADARARHPLSQGSSTTRCSTTISSAAVRSSSPHTKWRRFSTSSPTSCSSTAAASCSAGAWRKSSRSIERCWCIPTRSRRRGPSIPSTSVRGWAAASCCSRAWTGSNWLRWARCGRQASPICSSPS